MYIKEPVRKMRFAFLRPSQEVEVQFKKPDLGCVRRLKRQIIIQAAVCWAMKAAGVIVCPKLTDKLAVFLYFNILLAGGALLA
jgi:hypothetical protein